MFRLVCVSWLPGGSMLALMTRLLPGKRTAGRAVTTLRSIVHTVSVVLQQHTRSTGSAKEAKEAVWDCICTPSQAHAGVCMALAWMSLLPCALMCLTNVTVPLVTVLAVAVAAHFLRWHMRLCSMRPPQPKLSQLAVWSSNNVIPWLCLGIHPL